MKSPLTFSRRSLLKWSAPVVTSVALPAHAATSACVDAVPVLSVVSSPKCSGTPPIGTAVISIASSLADCPLTIKSITSVTNDDKSDITNLPALPIDVDTTDAVVFEWTGPASDAVSCLPLAQIDVTIEYCCENGPTVQETFDLPQLLVDSVAV